MRTTEHLDRVKAKCQRMIDIAEIEPQSCMDSSVSAWKSTIAIIDFIEYMGDCDAKILGLKIIAEWPIELL